MTKITPKKYYSIIQSTVETALFETCSRLKRGGRLGWLRTFNGAEITVWFQLDKWGWDPVWGSKFTVEFCKASSGTADFSVAGMERLGYLLEGYGELDELRKLNNQVIQSLPGTRDGLLKISKADGHEVVLSGVQPDCGESLLGYDLWLSFYSEEDIRMWGGYFRDHLPAFAERFAKDERSPLGQARVRFNVAIGKVQDCWKVEDRIAILEAYCAAEPEAEFRGMAEAWLDRCMQSLNDRAC